MQAKRTLVHRIADAPYCQYNNETVVRRSAGPCRDCDQPATWHIDGVRVVCDAHAAVYALAHLDD